MATKKYDSYKSRQARYAAIRNAEGRDIGEIPKVVNPPRKSRCKKNFERFCKTYFPENFSLKFSATHHDIIDGVRNAVLKGELQSIACPRGTGKTSIAIAAVIWAILYGHRRFVVIVANSADKGGKMLEEIKTTLETNELLADDFPESVYPILALDRIAHRQKGQTCGGKPTRIEWQATKVVMATIPRSPCSGSVIMSSGLKGSELRGAKHMTASGESIRPDLVLIDDPQDSVSAASAVQTKQRVEILNGDIMGMAGPGKSIAGLLTCTVIRQNDLADQITDREVSPLWRGIKRSMMIKFPKDMQLWDDYNKIKTDDIKLGGDSTAAINFYKDHREEMDEGAEVYWEDRKTDDDVSAIQHAMDLYYRDERSFYSEYQNAPMGDDIDGVQISPDDIISKTNGLMEGQLPAFAGNLTAFIDVQGDLLYYAVIASKDDYTASIIEYNTWPKNDISNYFTLSNAPIKLSDKYGGMSKEAALSKGLTDLLNYLNKKTYKGDGLDEKIAIIGIDQNWSQSTEIVFKCAKNASGKVYPCNGRYYGASTKPMSERTKKRGDKVGLHWFIPYDRTKSTKMVVFDTNFWKSFVWSRLATLEADAGCLSIWGKRAKHPMLAEHIATSERMVEVTAGNRTVNEFKPLPGRDNHWFDCVVGAMMLLDMCGSTLGVHQQQKQQRAKKKVKFSEIQKKRKVMRGR